MVCVAPDYRGANLRQHNRHIAIGTNPQRYVVPVHGRHRIEQQEFWVVKDRRMPGPDLSKVRPGGNGHGYMLRCVACLGRCSKTYNQTYTNIGDLQGFVQTDLEDFLARFRAYIMTAIFVSK